MGQKGSSRPKMYFKEEKEENENKAIIDNEKVKLSFSLQNCIKNNNYKIKLILKYDNERESKFETEKLKPDKDNAVIFDTTYLVPYYFEKEQNIICNIKINDEIIEYNTTLGSIVGSRNSTLYRNISKEREEKIKIVANKVNISSKNRLKIHFIFKKEKNSKKFFKKHKFLFKITKNANDLYQSEIISNDGYLKHVIIPLYYLSPSFNIIFYNIKKEVLAKFSDLTYEKLLLMNGKVYPFSYNKKKSKTIDLLIDAELVGSEKTFLDYIKEGIQINLGIAIDFSKSNENLHRVYNDKMNRYEEAIKFCGDIVGQYDFDQLFPVWGFGADNIPEKFDKMCFPINFKEDPNIKNIDGVIQEYKNCLNKISFSEQAEFSPVIKHFTKIIKNDKENLKKTYYILLLLTDGKYDDRDKTIDEIVKASKLPMSIIIIGLQEFQNQTNGEFDIVYMIDSTSSMGNYLKAAKDQCLNISNELQNKFNDYNFQFGGVFYRDPIDNPNEKNEIFNLTNDVDSLKYFISCLKSYGGGDTAEDWVGGYDMAINQINWRNGIKLIIHICDADGHGRGFAKTEDHHPNESDKYLPLIEKCVKKQIKIFGLNINNGATNTFQVFKKLYDTVDKDKKGLYKYIDFQENSNLTEAFKDSIIEAANFVAMAELDGDKEPLVSSYGEKWERDIVQFVPYDKYKDNPKLLAEQVLEEIPAQVVQYYNNINIKRIKNEGFYIIDKKDLKK